MFTTIPRETQFLIVVNKKTKRIRNILHEIATNPLTPWTFGMRSHIGTQDFFQFVLLPLNTSFASDISIFRFDAVFISFLPIPFFRVIEQIVLQHRELIQQGTTHVLIITFPTHHVKNPGCKLPIFFRQIALFCVQPFILWKEITCSQTVS